MPLYPSCSHFQAIRRAFYVLWCNSPRACRFHIDLHRFQGFHVSVCPEVIGHTFRQAFWLRVQSVGVTPCLSFPLFLICDFLYLFFTSFRSRHIFFLVVVYRVNKFYHCIPDVKRHSLGILSNKCPAVCKDVNLMPTQLQVIFTIR